MTDLIDYFSMLSEDDLLNIVERIVVGEVTLNENEEFALMSYLQVLVESVVQIDELTGKGNLERMRDEYSRPRSTPAERRRAAVGTTKDGGTYNKAARAYQLMQARDKGGKAPNFRKTYTEDLDDFGSAVLSRKVQTGVELPGPKKSLMDKIKKLVKRDKVTESTILEETEKESAVKVLPDDHLLAMKVPKGGSMCANCKFLQDDTHCGNKGFIAWNGSSKLPEPSDEYCCDLYGHDF